MTDFDDTASQLSRLTELEVQQRRAQHLERRARAHEKLLLSAYSALSAGWPAWSPSNLGSSSNDVVVAVVGVEAVVSKNLASVP